MDTAVCYSRFNGTIYVGTSVPSRLVRCSSSRRSTSSTRLSRSRSTNTSIRSTPSRHNSTDRIVVVPPEIEGMRAASERNASNNSANGQANKREIFNYTLSIPSTINEETSRSSFSHTGMLDRLMFKAVLEVSERDINSACDKEIFSSANDPVSVLLAAPVDTGKSTDKKDNIPCSNEICHSVPTTYRVEPEGQTEPGDDIPSVQDHVDGTMKCMATGGGDVLEHSDGELLSSDDCDCDECDNLLLEREVDGKGDDFVDTDVEQDTDGFKTEEPFIESVICNHCD